MAVNGVEIIEGSEWVTREGVSGVISQNTGFNKYRWRFTTKEGRTCVYTDGGLFNTDEASMRDLSHPVVERKYNVEQNLSISEITARKEALQRKLEIYVHNEVSLFQSENCVSISDVFFDFTKEQKLIEVHPRLVLTKVNIEIKI